MCWIIRNTCSHFLPIPENQPQNLNFSEIHCQCIKPLDFGHGGDVGTKRTNTGVLSQKSTHLKEQQQECINKMLIIFELYFK